MAIHSKFLLEDDWFNSCFFAGRRELIGLAQDSQLATQRLKAEFGRSLWETNVVWAVSEQAFGFGTKSYIALQKRL